jgi:predicted nucleotidyltransferase
MLTNTQVEEIIHKIQVNHHPSRIYLFGSYAYGQPGPDSDLDLLVIKKSISDKTQELLDLKKDLISKNYSLDILFYSEAEFEQKKREGWSLFQNIEKNGKLLYAA